MKFLCWTYITYHLILLSFDKGLFPNMIWAIKKKYLLGKISLFNLFYNRILWEDRLFVYTFTRKLFSLCFIKKIITRTRNEKVHYWVCSVAVTLFLADCSYIIHSDIVAMFLFWDIYLLNCRLFIVYVGPV